MTPFAKPIAIPSTITTSITISMTSSIKSTIPSPILPLIASMIATSYHHHHRLSFRQRKVPTSTTMSPHPKTTTNTPCLTMMIPLKCCYNLYHHRTSLPHYFNRAPATLPRLYLQRRNNHNCHATAITPTLHHLENLLYHQR